MRFGLNAADAVVLREALMSYRNNHAAAEWREPSDGFRIAAADDLLGRLDAHGRMILAEQDERANKPVSREIGSDNGSETPESTLPTHESHNTAGIGTGVDERA